VIQEKDSPPSNLTITEELVTQHAEFIKSYRDFANSGAQKQDALLNEKAKAIVSEEMQKRLDDEAFKDLFGDDGPDTTTSKTPVVTLDSDDRGGHRESYVDYFNNQAQLFNIQKNVTPALNSLLDESD
jgi:hypothetical protein